MPEAATMEPTTATAATATPALTPDTPSLGWRAGLPDELKQNPDLANFKTVGDFAKHALEVETKAKELETKLGDYIPKLPEDATDEERNLYLNALGRPQQASEYEFDGEDKNAPEWTNLWKNEFHQLGLTKQQAKELSGKWNTQIQAMVQAHNDAVAKETTAAEQKLRTELGDKYDTNVELAKRLWQKHGEGEFDKTFADAPGNVRFGTIRALLKFAALTGEDTSPQGGHSAIKRDATPGFDYSKSPKPPGR
jgi:hypothetical protein